MFKKLLALFVIASGATVHGQGYEKTDVLSNNSVALTNKTFDCTLNTCLNFSSGINLSTPPTIGNTTPNTGKFTTVQSTGGYVAPGTLTMAGTYSGPGTLGQNLFGGNSTLTGTVSSAIAFAPYFTQVTSTNFTKTVGPFAVPAAQIDHYFGGSGDQGIFQGLSVGLHMTATTGNLGAGVTQNYVGASISSNANATDGGSSGAGNGAGALWGSTIACILNNGATLWHGCTGLEIDMTTATGASTDSTTGWDVILTSTDTVASNIADIGGAFAGQNNSTTGLDYGLSFGIYDGYWPMKSTGTMIGCFVHGSTTNTGTCGTTANGINWTHITFTGNAFASTGFTVDGSGNLTAKTLTLAPGTALSQATWGTAGIGLVIPAATYNDTTTGSGGVSEDAAYAIAAPTITNTQGTSNTLTNEETLFVALPICGSGWTACSSKWAIKTNGGIFVGSGLLQAGGGATINGGAIALNNNSNSIVNIGTGTDTQTVTIGGGSNAVTVNATTFTANNISVTGLITPTTTQGIKGTTGADQPAAGSMGEVASIHCVVTAAGASGSAVSLPLASPGVVTWTGHTFVPSTGLANYTCPINFLANGGTLPTGITAGTNYYIIGSSVSGDTFQVSDTPAHALAGTNAVNFTGTSSGSPLAYIGALGTNNSTFAGASMALVAGDWDCTYLGEFQELTSLTITHYAVSVDTAVQTTTIGNTTDLRWASSAIGTASVYLPTPVVRENISGTTNIFGSELVAFSGGTMNEGGFLRCRRMR